MIAGGGVQNIFNDLVSENPNLVTPFGNDGSLSAAYVTSFWILVGVGVIGLPQVAVRAMSYSNSRSMHRALDDWNHRCRVDYAEHALDRSVRTAPGFAGN